MQTRKKWNLKCQKSECWVCYSVNINEVQPQVQEPRSTKNIRHLGMRKNKRTMFLWLIYCNIVGVVLKYLIEGLHQIKINHPSRMPINARIHTCAVTDPRIQNAAHLCQWSLLTWCKKLKKYNIWNWLLSFLSCVTSHYASKSQSEWAETQHFTWCDIMLRIKYFI